MNGFFAEFFYSAIFWGSTVTAFLWWLRSKVKGRFGRAAIWLPLGWFALHTVIAWYGFLIPPSGRLIDADSGEPIGNKRVIATWVGYPLAIWTSYCSGKQAHLSDEDGNFSFRLAPYPTLFLGTLARGLNPEVPGRIDNRKVSVLLAPIWGDLSILKYSPGRTVLGGPNTECDVDVAPQYPNNLELLLGEKHPFEVMYREACVEHKPWTMTDRFVRDMMLRRPNADNSTWPILDPPPEEIQRLLLDELKSRGCPPIGNECVSAISQETHGKFCTYFASLSPEELSHE